MAGGFARLGSVRHVYLIRKGKQIVDLDLYEFMQNGYTKYDDIILQDDDVVKVPTYESIVEIKGSDKVLVGDFAAKIRKIRPPEPYKGSGIKYQGEHIVRKAGKAAGGK